MNFGPLSRAQTKQSAISWTIPKTFPWRSEETSKVTLDAKDRFKPTCLPFGRPHNFRSMDEDFIFQSSLLIIPTLLAGSDLWIGAVIRADDCCAQLFRHLPGQQTVHGSFSRAPRASINEDRQRRRPVVKPAHVQREVQVQLLAPAAKRYALQSVHNNRTFSIYTDYFFNALQTLVKQTWKGFLNKSNFEINFSTPFHSAFGFRCSHTRTSTGSKVSRTGDI